jgi:hypothetical protein
VVVVGAMTCDHIAERTVRLWPMLECGVGDASRNLSVVGGVDGLGGLLCTRGGVADGRPEEADNDHGHEDREQS